MHSSRHCVMIVFFAALLLGSFCRLCAETVTITVVQNEAAPAVALEMSQTIEDEVFGDYFEAGHIVSNTDIRTDGSKFPEPYFGIKDAAFGLSDFLVVVFLSYGPSPRNDIAKKMTWAELISLQWRVVRVRNSEIVAEQSVDVSKIKITDFDPYKQSRLVADVVSEQTLGEIVKAKQGEKNK